MIRIDQTLIPFSKIPGWAEKNLGSRISPSTLHRWRLVGCSGVKLQTLKIGGRRFSSVEALEKFFESVTNMDSLQASSGTSVSSAKNVAQAESYLDSEWQ